MSTEEKPESAAKLHHLRTPGNRCRLFQLPATANYSSKGCLHAKDRRLCDVQKEGRVRLHSHTTSHNMQTTQDQSRTQCLLDLVIVGKQNSSRRPFRK